MKKALRLVVVTLFFSFLISGFTAYASDAEIVEKTLVVTKEDISNAGATNLLLFFEIGGAEVNLAKGADENIVVEAVVKYSEDTLEPSLFTTTVNDEYIANFRSGYTIGPQFHTVTHEWNITIGNYDIDTGLNLALGGVLADIDLGGIPLKNLSLELGGVGMAVDFSTPTTRSVENVIVASGGVYLAMTNIGNTDFGRFVVTGGGCAFDLDFHGTYSNGKHDVSMAFAADSLIATVPTEAGEQIKAVSFITPVILMGEGWEKGGRRIFYKEYVTDDYDFQDVQLDFNLNATTSSVIIDRN